MTTPLPPQALLELPEGLSVYKRTPEWSERTVPAALLHNHTTKPGVWARIVVLEGKLLYVVESFGVELELFEGRVGIVLPTVPHRVEPLGMVRFFVEFLRAEEP